MPTKRSINQTGKSIRSLNFKNFTNFRNFQLRNLLLPAIIVVAVLLLGYFKNQFIVATVNGKQITRINLITELEKKNGKAILESLITEQIILQEAEKRKINIPDSEINSEISKIEKSISGQGENLDTLLAQQGMTRDDLKKQVKIQLTLKAMTGGSVSVSEKEINDYIETNKESIPEGTEPGSLKTQVQQQLEQQKLNEKIQALIADLQKKAKVENFLK